MLFASLTYPDPSLLLPSAVDGIELRLDYLSKIDFSVLETFLHASKRLILFALRKKSQGGKFQGTEEERENLITRLLKLKPHFFDLEGDMRSAFLMETINNHPNTKFILSHHDFEKTPENLDEIFRSLARYNPFTCKIAAMANSTNDALRMLLFSKLHPLASMISMGEKGEFARVLGKTTGNVIDYAALQGQTPTGPGQLTVEELVEIYRYPVLNQETVIYGLIGNPVAKSPGHLYHNGVFRRRNVNALYIKMIVNPEELGDFIRYAKEINIRGLSVTIPLKEKILPYIDELDPKTREIGAANTLRFQDDRIYGTNTDGTGALDAIEKQMKVEGKKIALLGAGGAARGIAFEAKKRKASVTILNRTLSRAEKLAIDVGGNANGLNDVPRDTDILINCSPNPLPIQSDLIPPKALVMETVIVPQITTFLQEALSRGCHVVYGEEMFFNQAASQTQFWLDT